MKRPDDSSYDALAAEARRRGITVTNFTDINSEILLFEYENHHEFIYYSVTDHQGYVSFKIFSHKILTTHILRRAGFPVPVDLLTSKEADMRSFLEKYKKIVVKPVSNTGGLGVTPAIQTWPQLEAAIKRARENDLLPNESGQIVCQQHIEGRDYRVLVVNQKELFVIERIPAYVTADGKQTIQMLIDEYNKSVKKEVRIVIDDLVIELLQEQALELSNVPEVGQHVPLKRVANYHSGGRLHDATDQLGLEAKRITLAVARYFNVPLVGIDFISPDIKKEPGLIIECNSTPDITIHHYPDKGVGRNPAAAIISMLFPETSQKSS